MLIAESSSSSNPCMDETSTATITNNAATLTADSAKKSKLPLSTSAFSSSLSLSQTQTQVQQQQRSQSLPAADRSIPATTTISSSLNVFTNFPPSCCCRQMMMITKTPSTVTPTTTVGNKCKKKSSKNGSDSRLVGTGGSGGNSSNIGGPSPFRQLLPIALCILSFATVLSIMIVYMDTTEIRHQQFRLNMSRDYELHGVSQDNPTLIAFLREIHMKKYPMNFLKNARVEHLNFSEHHELTPEMAHYISNLVGGKSNGAFIQSITGATGNTMTGPWLAETLNWSGLLIEPEPRRYFTLRKQNVHRPKVQVVHACVSPSGYPKEVRIHNEDSEVRINSLLDEETSWFNTRVKCFPLYTLMLAINKVNYDLLSLGCAEHELQILQTLPFDKVNIEVISIHLTDDNYNNSENFNRYVRNITKFLFGKSYKFQKKFENNYIYQKINSNKTKTYKQFRKISPTISSITTPISTTTKMTGLAKLQQRQQYSNKN